MSTESRLRYGRVPNSFLQSRLIEQSAQTASFPTYLPVNRKVKTFDGRIKNGSRKVQYIGRAGKFRFNLYVVRVFLAELPRLIAYG